VVPPLKQSEASRSPKLNGAVERAQRTHTEEFYQVTNCSLETAALIANCGSGRKPTTPCAATNFSATPLPHCTCSSGMLIRGTECVTNLLDNLGVIGSRL
jgi:hypothetical protein